MVDVTNEMVRHGGSDISATSLPSQKRGTRCRIVFSRWTATDVLCCDPNARSPRTLISRFHRFSRLERILGSLRTRQTPQSAVADPLQSSRPTGRTRHVWGDDSEGLGRTAGLPGVSLRSEHSATQPPRRTEACLGAHASPSRTTSVRTGCLGRSGLGSIASAESPESSLANDRSGCCS